MVSKTIKVHFVSGISELFLSKYVSTRSLITWPCQTLIYYSETLVGLL